MPATQENRQIAISTPLGKDKLLLRRFSYKEQLGRLFHLDAELLSSDDQIAFEDIVGQKVTIELDLGAGKFRYFNGIVSSFSQTPARGRYACYHATIVPWFWLLTRTSDCRIFQQKTVPDIIKQIFKEYGFTDVKDMLKGTYTPWVYCVQYRETDFNFVSRLMEQEGFYYFWEHGKDKHDLVLADDPTAHVPFPDYDKIKFRPEHEGYSGGEDVSEWTVRKEVQPGTYALTDYNFEKPRASLMSKNSIARKHAESNFEIYDYPGEYDVNSEGQDYSKVRLQELQSQYETAVGSSDARGISSGFTFTLEEHPRKDQNRDYLVTSAQWVVDAEDYESNSGDGLHCSCSFEAIDSQQNFRPSRVTPKPIIQGPQTAVVVGPKGEEIYTDKYGRVKVQFHWDRQGKSDENSSCWIRVAQVWAGKKWGAVYIPRIGQEVVVEFLEGDPDQPLITGSVYNDEQKVPYDLPAEQTKSTLKSNSSKGGEGFNEIRFEDKKGKEQVFIHAERNMDVRVKNDEMERVIGNRHLIAGWEKDGSKGGDQREMVYQNKHLKVHRNHVEHIGGDMQLLIGGVDSGEGNQEIVLKGTKKESVEKDIHLHVKGKRNEQVDGDQSFTVGGSQQEKIGQKHAVDAGQEIHLKAGMKVIIEAGMQLTIKGPGGFVDIGPAGVTISGTLVLINSGGAAGSGSGSSPTAPEDAKEAAPTEPAKADDAKSGQKSSQS